MGNLFKLELIKSLADNDHPSVLSYGDAVRFATKMVIEYEKKGFLPNEFIELKTFHRFKNDIGWDTALYEYANYLFDL